MRNKELGVKAELVAPAGNLERLKTALHFGADAVYFSGKSFGLRAFSENFEDNEITGTVALCHARKAKAYITLNIFAHNADFGGLKEHLQVLTAAKADAVIVSDPGIFDFVKENAPGLPVHISTQANITNKYAAQFWARQGASRIVLARELSLKEIKEIRGALPEKVGLEAFVHGAVCISYSGRCLLSNYLSSRDGNKGECVQACRWEYALTESKRQGEPLTVSEDKRGTYILNSRDMNCLEILPEMIDAGITAFKIEGRTKAAFYVGTVVNAYRRALDLHLNGQSGQNGQIPLLQEELLKTGGRGFTTGFYMGDKDGGKTENFITSKPQQTAVFAAAVLGYDAEKTAVLVEQRNRFKVGDTLEIVSPLCFGKAIEVKEMSDADGNAVTDAYLVQQKLYIKTDIKLQEGDILRKHA